MHHSNSPRRPANILITVLWIIVVLVVIVSALAFEARSDVERAVMIKDRATAYWLARAAVERVKFDFAQQKMNMTQEEEDKRMRFSYQFDRGGAECLLRSSTSAMSINSTDEAQWDQLLKLFVENETQRIEIVHAILDWRDPDDLPQLNGVERDYYESLSPAYSPRNGPFQSVEELLLVKGITEAMFYGNGSGPNRKPGLNELLSVGAPNVNKFDINGAPEGILMAFLECDAEMAAQIVQAREQKMFESIDEVESQVGVGNPDLLRRFFSTYRGNQFTIRCTGYTSGSDARATVEDEVRYIGGNKLYINLSHTDFSLDHVDEAADTEEEESL